MISRGLELREDLPLRKNEALKEIPIIGRVAAGNPIVAEENWEGVINVDAGLFRGEGHFALKVRGDSMKNVGIFDGDIVIARQQATADKGEIVVAIIGEEATVKRYMPQGDDVLLVPENKSYNPIKISRGAPNFRIAGKVTGLLRKY